VCEAAAALHTWVLLGVSGSHFAWAGRVCAPMLKKAVWGCRYYYAIVTCDSAATADALYAQCDGREWQGRPLDLRFMSDHEDEDKDDGTDAESDGETDVATTVPANYKPLPLAYSVRHTGPTGPTRPRLKRPCTCIMWAMCGHS
jgi:hypothetical protein